MQFRSIRQKRWILKDISCRGIRIVSECVEKDDSERVYNKTINILNQHPELDAIYVTLGSQATVAKAIEDCGRKNKVIVVGFDENQEIYSYISKGIIYATIKQDPFGQGRSNYMAVYHIVTGEPFPRENMGCSCQ